MAASTRVSDAFFKPPYMHIGVFSVDIYKNSNSSANY